jgi:ferredoxin-NADP reductase/fatty acid desaturase
MSITAQRLKVREVVNQVVNDPEYHSVSHVPLISGHQISLILFAYVGVLGSIALYFQGVSLWLLYPVMIFAFYSAFTPLHDATHRAISSNNFLNDLLGTISGTILLPFSTTSIYRYLHLSHHRYVGDKDLDPDDTMVVVPTKYFPFGYLILFFPDFIWLTWLLTKGWKRAPSKTRVSTIFMFVGNISFMIAWFISPYWYEYLLLFFIPNRIGVWCVAYSFAHIQHPEGMKWNDFPFQTTYRLKANELLSKMLYGQSHHAIHHLLPHVPWYKYFLAWRLANGAFNKQDIPARGFLDRPDSDYKERFLNKLEKFGSQEISVKVSSIEQVATDIKSFNLQPIDGQPLPEFSAGSHIEIILPSGTKRHYSLVNPPFEDNSYRIAVKLEVNGNGGSREMHEAVKEGHVLQVSEPRNNFLLYENAKRFILISGGIGITPLLSMAHRLNEMDKGFEFHICAKAEHEIPFKHGLDHWSFSTSVEIHLDKNARSSIDLKKVLASPSADTLIYVCGPSGFNKWVKQEAIELGWNESNIKKEVFSIDGSESSEPQAFELILNKSQRVLKIEKDQTIIDALEYNDIDVNYSYSCMQGTCGTCVTDVLEGEIDHRDAFLTEEEKTAQNKMCLCVSRAKKERVILDL